MPLSRRIMRAAEAGAACIAGRPPHIVVSFLRFSSGGASPARSAAQQLQRVLELDAELPHDLLRLAHIRAGLLARELVPRAGDRESLLVEEAADLADDDHVLSLVVAPVTAPLDGLQLWEFLLPIAQHVRLDAAELAHLADREVALARDRREGVVILWLQHRLRPAPLVSGPGEMSPPAGH